MELRACAFECLRNAVLCGDGVSCAPEELHASFRIVADFALQELRRQEAPRY